MYRNNYHPTKVLRLPYRGTFQTRTHTDMVFKDIVHSCSGVGGGGARWIL